MFASSLPSAKRKNMIIQKLRRSFSSTSRYYPGSLTFYRTKSALKINPIAAKRERFTTKDGLSATRVSREGSLLLSFAAANQGHESGTKYLWNNSILIGLTTLELGSILVPIPEDKGLTFLRDSNITAKLRGDSMGDNMASGITKRFSISHTEQRNGYWFNMKEENQGQEKKISLAVTHADMAVIRSLTSSILPSLIGWDHLGVSNSNSSDDVPQSSGQTNSPPGFVSEGKSFFDPQY